MANHCYFDKNLSKEDLVMKIKEQFFNKFRLNVEFNDGDYNSCFKIKGLEFPIWEEEGNYVMYDCMDTALFHKGNNLELCENYKDSVIDNFYPQNHLACAYSYLYYYFQHFIAVINQSKIKSDGAGDFEPFSGHPERFNNYKNWFNFHYRNRGIFLKLINRFLNNNKAYDSQKEFFPELF